MINPGKYLLLLFVVVGLKADAQQLNLQEAVGLAQNQSIAYQQSVATKEKAHWEFMSFQAQFKPQLTLNATIPSFTKSYVQVVQPNGSINFQKVSNNNSIANLSINQTVSATGGTIFIQKQLQRFDDFVRNKTSYNGIPFSLGIEQPLFRFNPLKWQKKVEPLRYKVGNQRYIAEVEQIAVVACDLFFELLISQVNLEMAEKNRQSSDTLYKIAIKRMDMGRISQNDLLQLQLSVINAQKDVASADQSLASSALRLRTYIGAGDRSATHLDVPEQIIEMNVDISVALEESTTNRAEFSEFQLSMTEAERDLNLAVKESGLNASLVASFGLTNQGNRPTDIYRKPQDREYLELRLTLPIMTWGRRQAQVKIAEGAKELVTQSIAQGKVNFRQQITTQVELFHMFQKQISLTKQADEITRRRFEIAQNRFLLGDLSVTDLAIAMREKDQGKRDYIIALRNYWRSYYNLRALTLFDFCSGKRISNN